MTDSIDKAIARAEEAVARVKARKQPIVSMETETKVAWSLARLTVALRQIRERKNLCPG